MSSSSIGGPRPSPFSAKQIALLETFADQAVIAIENVRLFQELRARTAELTRSVEQLTALGEVGRAVSSTLDLETRPADTIVVAGESTGRRRRRRDLRVRRGRASCSTCAATPRVDAALVETLRAMPLRKGRGGDGARGGDARAGPDSGHRGPRRRTRASSATCSSAPGYRALLSVPLLREDQIIGSLSVNRKAPGAFAPEVIERPEDLRHAVGPGDPERPPLPRDRGQGPAARGREPPQVGVPGQHVP